MRNKAAAIAHVVPPLLGLGTGLRSFTPLATAAWFARTGKLPLEGTWASWFGHPAAVGLLTAGAVGECIADKLPNAPNRTLPIAVAGRLIFAGLLGGIIATAFKRPVWGGVAFGALGALAGTYGGFYARTGLTGGKGVKDLPVALGEDALAISLAVGSLRRVERG